MDSQDSYVSDSLDEQQNIKMEINDTIFPNSKQDSVQAPKKINNQHKMATITKIRCSQTIRLKAKKGFYNGNHDKLIEEIETYIENLFTEEHKTVNVVQLQNISYEKELDSKSMISKDGKEVFVFGLKVKRRNKVLGEEDVNHGDIKVGFWVDETEGVKIYCSSRARQSNLWTKLLRVRDKTFGGSVAKSILDPNYLTNVETVPLLGYNAGTNKVVYKKKNFTKHDIMDSYGIMKTYKTKVLKKEEEEFLQDFPVSKSIAKMVFWEVMVGQIKVPVLGTFLDTSDELHELFYLLDCCSQKPDLPGWEHLEYIKVLDVWSQKENKYNIEAEFQKCVENEKYTPTSFSLNDPLRASVVNAFHNSNDVTLDREEIPVSWVSEKGDKCSNKNGSDITVEDLIKSIRKDRDRQDSTSYSLSWNWDKFQVKRGSIFDYISANFVTDKETIFKVGKDYYEINPDYETHLMTNYKFIQVLKEDLVEKGKLEENAFGELLSWNTGKQEGGEKDKPVSFTIKEVLQECIIESEDADEDTRMTDMQVENELKDILLKKNKFLDASSSICLSNYHKLNCSILKNSELGEKIIATTKKKHLSNASKLLLTSSDKKEKITNYDLCKALEEDYVVCKEDLDQFITKNPYLTISAVEQLKATKRVCIDRLLQFLRSRLSLDEGDYNELYHLSNCPCHSKGWTFIVGDRILCGTTGIELFDVMAYHEVEEQVYMFHVKEKADAGAARAACSQVRVCGEEVRQSITIGMKEDIFDLFYERAVTGPDTIHYQLVASKMKSLGTKEEFNAKMRKCKFFICLALADPNGASKWHLLKDVDIGRDLSTHLPQSHLELLKGLGYVSKKNNSITQMILDNSKTTVVEHLKKEVGSQKDAESCYDSIFEAIEKPAKLTSSDLQSMLSAGKYITKNEICSLYKSFYGLMYQKVNLQITPVDCNFQTN